MGLSINFMKIKMKGSFLDSIPLVEKPPSATDIPLYIFFIRGYNFECFPSIFLIRNILLFLLNPNTRLDILGKFVWL